MASVNLLPNFLIIGAAKSGTTALYDLLKQHPQVYLPFDKEPLFFSRDDYFAQGAEWYAERYFKEGESFRARGEATPHYLYWAEKVAPRIARTFGGRPPKFIAIFRDPVQRAYSWYWKQQTSMEHAMCHRHTCARTSSNCVSLPSQRRHDEQPQSVDLATPLRQHTKIIRAIGLS